MNERIRELIAQSDNGQFHNGKFYPHIGSRNLKDWERFAELIVRECMNAVCNPKDTMYMSMTESSAMYAAREAIIKHFGVK